MSFVHGGGFNSAFLLIAEPTVLRFRAAGMVDVCGGTIVGGAGKDAAGGGTIGIDDAGAIDVTC